MITKQEYERRLEAARALMTAQGLDAIVVTGEANLRYFAGFAPHMYVSPTRPWFAVLPRVGQPVALLPEMGRADAARDSWFTHFKSWPSPRWRDEGVSLLADVLGQIPRKFGRVGFELGPESRLGMPVMDFLSLRDLIAPHLDVADAAPLIQSLRARKSDSEIALIRAAIKAAQAAFDEVPKIAGPGLSEADLYRAFQSCALKAGAERVPYVALASGPDGYDSIVRGPRADRTLDDGDILAIDTGVTIGGYWADFNRNWSVGTKPVSTAAERAYESLWRAQAAALALLRPGVKACEVWQAMADAMTPPDQGSANTAVGRFGHGLGLDYTEPPSLHPDDRTVLLEGMVITLEPSLTYVSEDTSSAGERFMALEEDVLITEGGPVLLTRRATPHIESCIGSQPLES